jgi:hypothetical protein
VQEGGKPSLEGGTEVLQELREVLGCSVVFVKACCCLGCSLSSPLEASLKQAVGSADKVRPSIKKAGRRAHILNREDRQMPARHRAKLTEAGPQDLAVLYLVELRGSCTHPLPPL